MEEITFEDMLTHYSLKLNEIDNMLDNVSSYMKKCDMIVVQSWNSAAEKEYEIKSQQIAKRIDSSQTLVHDILAELSAISGAFVESQVTI